MTATTLAEQTASAKPSFVYVIGHDGNNVVKIGKADDVSDRLASIQRMSPVKLRLLAHYGGGFRYETALHRQFDHLRTHGEWFDFGDLDPVAEVSAAVAVLVEADEAEARASAKRAAAPGTVVQIRKKLWVMQGDGQFQCVDSVKDKRRCRNLAVDCDELPRVYRWAIPGIGFVEGYALSPRDKYDHERIMMQLCQSHYDSFGLEQYYDRKLPGPVSAWTRPMWEPFNLAEHVDLIKRDEPGRMRTPASIVPDLADLEPVLNERMAKGARRLTLASLSPAAVAAFQRAGLIDPQDAEGTV